LIRYWKRKGFHVFCLDECTFVIEPYAPYGWFPKGSNPAIKTNYTRKRFHALGALGMKSFYMSFSRKINKDVFLEFLKKLLRKRGKILVLMDNARWHKAKIVQKFAEENRHRIKIEHFLKYTPELNPIEPRWKEMKKELGCRLFKETKEMKAVVRRKSYRKDFFTDKMFGYLCL